MNGIVYDICFYFQVRSRDKYLREVPLLCFFILYLSSRLGIAGVFFSNFFNLRFFSTEAIFSDL